MTRRGAVACVAAFAAAVSVGALGYAVLWAFDLSELVRPAAQEQQAPEQRTKDEAPPASVRRRPLVIVAPRIPGDDARAIVSSGAHAVAVGGSMAPPMGQGGEPSVLVAVAPSPTPAAPGVDAPAISASARVSAPSSAVGRPMPDNSDAVSTLIPQSDAAAPPPPPVQVPARAEAPAPPDPEATGTVRPPALIFHRPRPIQRPRDRDDVMAGPPGVTIIRGVPPVPAASPGIVRPGPLIIQVPSAPRR